MMILELTKETYDFYNYYIIIIIVIIVITQLLLRSGFLFKSSPNNLLYMSNTSAMMTDNSNTLYFI